MAIKSPLWSLCSSPIAVEQKMEEETKACKTRLKKQGEFLSPKLLEISRLLNLKICFQI